MVKLTKEEKYKAARTYPNGIKTCTKCKESKQLLDFTFEKKQNNYNSQCKKCINSRKRNKLCLEGQNVLCKEDRYEDTRTYPDGVKTCTKCNESKQLSDFLFVKKFNNYNSHCRLCINAGKRQKYADKLKSEGKTVINKEEKYEANREYPNGLKTCTRCNIEKKISEFIFLKKTNNYKPQCKTCVNEQNRQSYANRLGKVVLSKEEKYKAARTYPDGVKTCTTCKESKQLADFYFHTKVDNYTSQCKKCIDAKNMQNYNASKLPSNGLKTCKTCNEEKQLFEFTQDDKCFANCEKCRIQNKISSDKKQAETRKTKYEADRIYPNGLKTCSICKEDKQLSEFSFKKRINNYITHCKVCYNNKRKIYYDKLKSEGKILSREDKYKAARTYPDGLKTCTKCNESKRLSEFSFNKQTDNYKPQCKKCINCKYREYNVVKICTKCNESKRLSEFYFDKKTNNYRGQCNICIKNIRKQIYLNNINKEKSPELKTCTKCNIEKSISDFSYNKITDDYSEDCKKCKNKYSQSKKSYPDGVNTCNICNETKPLSEFSYLKNRNYYKTSCKQCTNQKARTDKIRKQNNARLREKLKDPKFRIRRNLRLRIYHAVKDNSKSDHTMNLIGCTIDFLHKWLEFQFTEDMSFDNYGTVWHIDHCVPCNSFDMSDSEQQKICFNWSNLQPLHIHKNLLKKDTVIKHSIMMQEMKKTVFLKSNNISLIQSSGTLYDIKRG